VRAETVSAVYCALYCRQGVSAVLYTVDRLCEGWGVHAWKRWMTEEPSEAGAESFPVTRSMDILQTEKKKKR